MDFLTKNLPQIVIFLGIIIAIVPSGIGSAKGAAMIGKAASALISEQPEKFGQALILLMMSASQGLYGFIIGFLSFTKFGPDLDIATALGCLAAGLIVGIAGYFTAVHQSAIATAGIQILAKKPEHSTKGVLFSAMVETYAIFAFVVAVLIVL